MTDKTDWSLATFEGLRKSQRKQFRALPLHEKIAFLEQSSAVARHFASMPKHKPRIAAGRSERDAR